MRGIQPFHHQGPPVGALSIDVGRHVAGLPGAVHLVAQAPQLHAVGLGVAVPCVGPPSRSPRQIAVLQQLGGLGGAGGAEVHRQHRRGAKRSRPRHEFVGAELIGLDVRQA